VGPSARLATLLALTACAGDPREPNGPRNGANADRAEARLVRGAGGHMCIRDAEVVTCWGMNMQGQLGPGELVIDVPRTMSSTAADVALGGNATCIVDRDRVVSCIGEVPFDLRTTKLSAIGELTGATRVAVSSTVLCAERPAGGVACRGRFDTGLLGPGVIHDSRSMVPILGVGAVIDLVVSDDLACVRTPERGVVCWGQPWMGIRRGFSPPTGFVASDMPAEIVELRGASEVSLGRHHACALVDGRAICWGSNARGQLGESSVEYDFTPRPVWDLEGLAGLASGGDHTCAWDGRGRVFCWGSNDYGQLGNGAMGPVFPPSRVSGIDEVVAISAGPFSTCAETRSRDVWCWGSDGRGQALVRPRKVIGD
jgi:alpha-tubulin suppressor-like RCC1 family protein